MKKMIHRKIHLLLGGALLLTAGFTNAADLADPPETWQEHWFEHVQLLKRVYFDDQVAVYFDDDMDVEAAGWLFQFTSDVWAYTKSVYGDFGDDPRMFGVFHQGKYGGGHPSTYFDASHDNRNMIDLGAGPWNNPAGWAIDATVHEVGHIVEGASYGVHGSPAFGIWGDSKWCEIFVYDVYNGIGWDAEAEVFYNNIINGSDNFPRAGTQWFKNWFYPIYRDYGGNRALTDYFRLLSENFRKNGESYAGGLNMGEFVLFWSGAAGEDLQPLAEGAFGWTSEYADQYARALEDFPEVMAQQTDIRRTTIRIPETAAAGHTLMFQGNSIRLVRRDAGSSMKIFDLSGRLFQSP